MNNKTSVISFKVSDKTSEMMSEELDWCKRPTTPAYAKWQAKDGDTVITLYESGKVVFQGKDADLASDFWIQTEKINTGKVDVKNSSQKDKKDKKENIYIDPKIYHSNSIGSDEVGTGDYFGPIVVTATYVTKENISFLEELGVRDSKKMTDEKILEVVPKVIKVIPYESVILSNKEYNDKYNSDINMNKIKAIMHNRALSVMKNKFTNYDYIVVDQFAKPFVYFNYLKTSSNVVKNITFITKAEDKCLSVACASIISRYIFLKEFDKLSKSLNVTLLKGASTAVDDLGVTLVKKYGIDRLNSISKLNFKNTEKIKAKLEN